MNMDKLIYFIGPHKQNSLKQLWAEKLREIER